MIGFWRAIAAGSEGARPIELPGVFAAVVPAVPERSVFNSVIYEDADALEDALSELARAYEEARVAAWTVWVPEEDERSASLLRAAGHRLDAEPRAMGMALDEVERPSMEGIDWDRDSDLETVGAVNDSAYGYPPGTFSRGMGTPPAGARLYQARLDGWPVATVATLGAPEADDCGVYLVATRTEARGRGLSTALMRQAVWDARQRGLRTTTLQATKAGRPVYERIGYRDFGALKMWERRP